MTFSRRFPLCGTFAFAGLMLAGAASAQTGKEAEQFTGLTSGGSLTAPDTIPSSGFKDTDAKAELSSEGDQVNANFAFTLNRGSAPHGDQETVSGTFFSLSLKASVPLNGNKEGSVVNFKTFGNNGKLTLGFNFFRPTYVTAVQDDGVIKTSERFCIVKASRAWAELGHDDAADRTALDQILMAYDKARSDPDNGAFDLLDAATGLSPGEGSLGSFVRQRCGKSQESGLTNDERFAEIYAREALDAPAYKAWRRKHHAEGTFYFGGEVSIGYNRFSVINRPTLTLQHPDRVGFDGNGHVGYIFPRASTMLLVESGYTRTYAAQDKVDVCGPPNPQGQSICINGEGGLPTRKDTGYVGASWRQVLLRNSHDDPVLGMRPSATYIFEDKDWQFALPVYFQRNESGGLDAGVKATYNTGKKKFEVGAFVGLPF